MSEELTEDELDLIDARAGRAIAGPWEAFVEGRDHIGGDDFIRTGGLDDAAPDLYVSFAYPNNPGLLPAGSADLDFIAASRQDVVRLVAEVRRLRALLP